MFCNDASLRFLFPRYTLAEEDIMAEDKTKCPHGEPDGKLVYCSRPAEETGALAVWKRAVCGRIIVTPGWCRDRCKLHGGPGHL